MILKNPRKMTKPMFYSEKLKSGATLKPYDSGAEVRFGRAVFCEFSTYAAFRQVSKHAQKPGWFLSVAPGFINQGQIKNQKSLPDNKKNPRIIPGILFKLNYPSAGYSDFDPATSTQTSASAILLYFSYLSLTSLASLVCSTSASSGKVLVRLA